MIDERYVQQLNGLIILKLNTSASILWEQISPTSCKVGLLLSFKSGACTGGICLPKSPWPNRPSRLCWQSYGAGAARFSRAADVLQHAHEDQQTHQVQARPRGGQGQGDLISSAGAVVPATSLVHMEVV